MEDVIDVNVVIPLRSDVDVYLIYPYIYIIPLFEAVSYLVIKIKLREGTLDPPTLLPKRYFLFAVTINCLVEVITLPSAEEPFVILLINNFCIAC